MKNRLVLLLGLSLTLVFVLTLFNPTTFSLGSEISPSQLMPTSQLTTRNVQIMSDDWAGNGCGDTEEIRVYEGDMICVSAAPSEYAKEFIFSSSLKEYDTSHYKISYRWYIYTGDPRYNSARISGSAYTSIIAYGWPPHHMPLDAPKTGYLQRVLKPNQRIWACFKITDDYGVSYYALKCTSGSDPGLIKDSNGWHYYSSGIYDDLKYNYADDPRISWRTTLSGTYKGGSKQKIVVRWDDDAIGDLHLSCSIDGYADKNNQCTSDSPDLWDYQDPSELDEASSSGTLSCYLRLPEDTSSHTVRCEVHDDISGWSNEIESSFNTDSTPPSGFSITSVDGDTSSPYMDKTNDGKTLIKFHVSGASKCRWGWSDTTYTGMSNQCESTSQCTITGVNTNNRDYYAFISCTDAYGNENDGNNNLNIHWTTDWNAPPTITGISLTQPAYTNTTLVCNAEFSDPDYGPWTIEHTWKVNNNIVESGSTTQSSTGGVSLSLQPEKFKKGDIVSCNLRVTDSQGASDEKATSTTILNTPPTEPSNISWSSDNNMTTFNLTAWGSHDEDNDQITYQYQAYYNSEWHTTTDQWDASNVDEQLVKFRARASDGQSYSNWLESPSIKLDHEYLPVLLDLGISPKNPHFDDNLTANATYYDKDGDPEEGSKITWEINGINYTSNPLSGLISRGDNVTLHYTPCNQKQCGKTYSTSIVILNYPPSALLNYPSLVKGNTSYKLLVNALDKDGDNISLTCFLDGVQVLNTNGTGQIEKAKPVLSPATEGNHTLECKAYDGINQTNASLELEVDNTPPNVSIQWPELTNKEFLINTSASEPVWVKCKGTSHGPHGPHDPNDPYDPHDSLGNITSEGTINASSCLPQNTSGNITVQLEFLDLVNNSRTVELTTYLDLDPPILEASAPIGIVLPNITLTANASDDYGLDFLGYKLDNGNLIRSNNLTLEERGTHNISWIAKDKAGNTVQKNITIRINQIPRADATIPGPLYADSKLVCKPVNITNEPDQSWNYTTSWLKNGKPINLSNYSLARGDNLTCILNITDALGESSLTNDSKLVQNKPPTILASWEPEFPSPRQDIKIVINVSDMDGDNLTWKANFSNQTWNETIKTIKAGNEPRNYTLDVWAWDGFNWTNVTFQIPHHLCGNKILEPGEECDGQTSSGFKCQQCKLVKVQDSNHEGNGGSSSGSGRSSGGGGSRSGGTGNSGGGGSGGFGGGYISPEITPKLFDNLPFVGKLEKSFGYKTGQNTKTYWKINFTIARNMSWIQLEDKIPDGFEKVECNVGKCKIENGTLLWEAKNLSSREKVEIALESKKELLLAEMQRNLESSEKPKIIGKIAYLEAKSERPSGTGNEERQVKASEKTEIMGKTDSKKAPRIPIIKEKLETGKLDITGLVENPGVKIGLNIILSLIIIMLGFRYRKNLRRLSARIHVIRVKVRPKK